MLCPICKTYADAEAIVCPACGRMLPRGENKYVGAMAIRQGRRAREAVEEAKQEKEKADKETAADPLQGRQGQSRSGEHRDDAAKDDDEQMPPVSREPGTRTTYGEAPLDAEHNMPQRPIRRKNQHLVTKRMTNWTHVAIGLIVAVVVLAIGVMLFLTRTAPGQRIMARMGREANATALWEVGEEKLDTGDIQGAIDMFLRARELDGEDNVNVAGLLLLGSAYEASGMMEEAEALYAELYTDIVPSAPDAYTNNIRIMISQGREAEAAALMELAYQRTGNVNFRNQRREMLPAAPEVNVTAGTYDAARTLQIISPDGFDVYYTFDEEAALPEEGTLFTEGVYIDEGMWKLRAVAVNGDLISDELTGTYRVVMPSPGTPNCNLAPNTYTKRHSVRLRVNPDNAKDDDIVIYYTIDGSLPDEDSPIYDGGDIQLPSGRVTLQAVAVNSYGKASNTFSRTFKFEVKPYPQKSYTVEDTANGITLYATTLEQFQAKYGKENETEEVLMGDYEDGGVKYIYNWGYAVFSRTKGVDHLIELYFTDHFKGPRGTGIGDSENEVVSKFCDMGQVASPSGNRGLYNNTNGTGKIYVEEDGTRRIRYVTATADSHTWQLDYLESSSGIVRAIRMVYIP